MPDPETPPESGPTPWTPPPPAPARKAGLSRNTGIAIAAIVIVVVLILALFLAGVIPGLKSSSSSSPPATKYTVTFTESGLLHGTSWSVVLAGSSQSSTNTTVTFSETNGTYSFTVGLVTGYAATPASGSLTVSGSAVHQAITFVTGYSVTFSETGLTSGKSWTVTLGGTPMSSTTSTVVFSEANGTYAFVIASISGFAASPASGNVTVHGTAVTQAIVFTAVTTYDVTFTESGLPSPISWTVTLAGTPQSSSTTTITFSETNGSYAYSVGAVTGYTATPSSGTVPVSGMAASVTITFAKSTGPGGPAYAVTFDQTGLPSTDLWEVDSVLSVNSKPLYFGAANNGPTTEFAVPDGSYFWEVGTSTTGYVAVPSFGNLTVAGAPVTIHVVFEQGFPVNFTETGLASFVSWTVSLNGSTCFGFSPGNCSFSGSSAVPNGTYHYTVSALGYSASPASGSITVAGMPVVVNITFTALPTYTVTFTESGLAAATPWSINLNGSVSSSFAPGSITFNVPNGMYPFTVFATGYTASPASGTVTVSGGPASQAISFTAITTYAVTFSETGLATGTSWDVDLNGSFGTALAPTNIVVQAPNGANPFYVSATGYTANPASGTVTVSGGPASQAIAFTLIPPVTLYNVTFTESGLPVSSDWGVTIQTDGAYISSNYLCTNSTFGGTSLNCSVANGYYSWYVDTLTPNYTGNPMVGWLTISGHAASVSVTFVNSSTEYLAWFGEVWYSLLGTGGLPNGTSWGVTVNGVTQTTQGMWVTFLELNGSTSAYSINPPSGYGVLPSYGNLTGYANPYQSFDYLTVAVHAFVSFYSDPPASPSGILVGTNVSLAAMGSMVATIRDL